MSPCTALASSSRAGVSIVDGRAAMRGPRCPAEAGGSRPVHQLPDSSTHSPSAAPGCNAVAEVPQACQAVSDETMTDPVPRLVDFRTPAGYRGRTNIEHREKRECQQRRHPITA